MLWPIDLLVSFHAFMPHYFGTTSSEWMLEPATDVKIDRDAETPSGVDVVAEVSVTSHWRKKTNQTPNILASCDDHPPLG